MTLHRSLPLSSATLTRRHLLALTFSCQGHNDDNGRRRSERRHGQRPREEIDAALSAATQRLALQHRHRTREAPSADAQTGFAANSKHWFTTSFLQPLPYLVTPRVPEKMSANEQLFVGAQTVVCLLQTTQIKQGVSFIAANKVYISTNTVSYTHLTLPTMAVV